MVRWCCSAWYNTPKKDINKAYNPLLGETFSCMWEHGSSKTYCMSFILQIQKEKLIHFFIYNKLGILFLGISNNHNTNREMSCYFSHTLCVFFLKVISEQVCHHPPASAIYAENCQEGIYVTGSIYPRTYVSIL